ncbi:GNAT family N-acetyltransferase [Rhizobium etli]|uniref:GNAT family N-acetyltransferase n=1 Tax=Rhizobium etli TaxID=29449 RepID=UPI0012DB7702|nr:GNAT family N-acetyltransferase [Rhizobium etli]
MKKAELLRLQPMLSVVSSNVAAIRLYRSMGFKEWAVEVEALKVGDIYHDEILMRLELGP